MSGDDIYFRVSFADRVLEHLPTLEARAVAAGRQNEFAEALRTIHSWLRSDPASLGEPTRDYPEFGQTEHAAVCGPLLITFTIHWDINVVFVAKYLRIVRGPVSDSSFRSYNSSIPPRRPEHIPLCVSSACFHSSLSSRSFSPPPIQRRRRATTTRHSPRRPTRRRRPFRGFNVTRNSKSSLGGGADARQSGLLRV